MSHIHDDCGHSEEEHAQQIEGMYEDLSSGNLAPLYQTMPADLLALNMQGIFCELFVRSEDDVEFAQILADTVKIIGNTLIKGEVDYEDNPEENIREYYLKARKDWREQMDRLKDNPEAFAADANAEIERIISAHGVADLPKEDGDDLPGFYL